MSTYLKLDALREKLKELTGLTYFNGVKSELIVRCPLPGCELEHKKNHNHGRMYIDLNSPVFHCFRCGSSGTIFKLLRYLKLNPSDYVNGDHEVFKSGKIRKTTSNIFNNDNFENLNFKNSSGILNRYDYKLDYLRSRLGEDSQVENLPNLVLNIKDFIFNNKVELVNRDLKLLDDYESNYIGFVGNRGNTLLLRSIFTDSPKPYQKIPLKPAGYFKDFFGIFNKSINKDKMNTIVLGEGTWDVLLPYKSEIFKEISNESCFWGAALGSEFTATLTSILDYVKLPQVNVILLSDRDHLPSDKIYKKLNNHPMVNNLKLVYNKFGHDFGKRPISPIFTTVPTNIFKKYIKPEKERGFR